MATTTNFGWTTPDDTALVKDGASAIRTLGSAIDTSMMDLKGGTTGQVLSKNSNTDMDFTWVAQDDSNAIQNALLTTTGDTIYASSASTPARLGIGSSGQVLTVSGGVPTWATPSTGSLTLLSTTNLSSTTTTISSISTAYTDLLILVQNHYWVTTAGNLRFRPNATANLCDYVGVIAAGSATNTNLGDIDGGGGGSTSSSAARSNASLYIRNYADTTYGKPFVCTMTSGTTNTAAFLGGTVGTTSAITSIAITSTNGGITFGGGRVLIYGVK